MKLNKLELNEALFNNYLDLHITSGNVRGDRSYGYDKWKK